MFGLCPSSGWVCLRHIHYYSIQSIFARRFFRLFPYERIHFFVFGFRLRPAKPPARYTLLLYTVRSSIWPPAERSAAAVMPSAGSLSAARAFSVPPYIRYPAASLFPCLSAKKGSSLPRFHARKPPFPIGAPNFCGDLPQTAFPSPRLSAFRSRMLTCRARHLLPSRGESRSMRNEEAFAAFITLVSAKTALCKTRKFLRRLSSFPWQKPPMQSTEVLRH